MSFFSRGPKGGLLLIENSVLIESKRQSVVYWSRLGAPICRLEQFEAFKWQPTSQHTPASSLSDLPST